MTSGGSDNYDVLLEGCPRVVTVGPHVPLGISPVQLNIIDLAVELGKELPPPDGHAA